MPTLTVTVNGRTWTGDVPADATLLDVLRDHLDLTGAKRGCGEGQCGSCTVLLGGRPVNACVTAAKTAVGHDVTTIEGMARGGALHPVQQAFIDAQAFQCGFCTPGMITAVVALLTRTPRPDDAQIRGALEGHVCRCGTYPRIVQAVNAAAIAMATEDRRG
jgi:aerobic-type carbon monoxide dehydrogenase small subunit (CoxS/CutS family)